ncbi:helix-turn-helix domain-containing protein [Terrilactibacillus laevilacticus]|uniref:Helix-turn-helix domain-containing protein n=1 Tax=Terrilactibacillus laevilacticus TaxID=1380157 RepID=A0ABW5PQT6_9BACI|nr:XRE family transcriptional regulator [Terrilactibacillus laevilacticus]
MDKLQEVIGHNLASMRKARGLSLDKVSDLTGVSKAMLGQIEKGRSNPTVSTLWKIASGLKVSFSELMQEDKPIITTVSPIDLEPIFDDEGHYLVYSLFPFQPDKKFEIYTICLKPGYEHHSDKHSEGVEEYVLVSEGELILEIQGDEHQLNKGESLHFKADTEHIYKNHSKRELNYFVILYYS